MRRINVMPHKAFSLEKVCASLRRALPYVNMHKVLECGGLPPLSVGGLPPWNRPKHGIVRRGQAPLGKAGASSRTPYWAIAIALVLVTAAHAQEAFDAEKTKALFAGTEWNTQYSGWQKRTVVFEPNGVMMMKAADGEKDKTDKWKPTGPFSVSGDQGEWTLSPDKKELYATGTSGRKFLVYYRGPTLPSEYPFLRATLTKPGIVWVQQDVAERITFALNAELDNVWGVGGIRKKSKEVSIVGGGAFITVGEPYYTMFYLVQSENGERFLRDSTGKVTLRPEPAQPGDPLPPQMIARVKSPFGGTSWCRMDGKGKVFTLTFAASGTVSDSATPNEKPEWNAYDDNSIRYKSKSGMRTLTLSEDKKRLVREDDKAREIWFSGRQPPRASMTETRQLKDLLADPSKAWVSWANNMKIVYTFDDKSANVSITVDDGKPTVARWESLCAGCIRIGDEAFMVEGETLERVEPRLMLKRVAKDSIR